MAKTELKEQAKQLKAEGKTNKLIAETLGVSAQTVGKWLSEGEGAKPRAGRAPTSAKAIIEAEVHEIDKRIKEIDKLLGGELETERNNLKKRKEGFVAILDTY